MRFPVNKPEVQIIGKLGGWPWLFHVLHNAIKMENQVNEHLIVRYLEFNEL